jgi:hypothetical protein
MQPDSYDSSEKSDYLASYSEYSKSLRTWILGYGIGGPVLLFTNNSLLEIISVYPFRNLIVYLFLSGVAIQVLLAFVNKWCAWYMYRGSLDSPYRKGRGYRFWCEINSWNKLDLLIDLVAIGVFSAATWMILDAILGQ